MSFARSPRSLNLTCNPLNSIPNYGVIRVDAKIPKIDDFTKFPNLSFLHDSKYAVLRETVLFPEKRIINIPRKRTNNWNNYIVHSMHSDYLESWRDYCKVPDNWIGPKLMKPC